ncbi:MAG: Flp pilus assembly protein CpaB [Gemmataceae bacterium]
MKASTLFSIVAAVFLGLIVVAAAKYSGLFAPKPPAPPVVKEKIKVLVTAKNLFESFTIQPADVRVRDMTPAEEEHYSNNKEKYLPATIQAGVMRTLTRSVEADQPLLREYVDDINLPQAINRRLSSPTMRAVNVAVPIERAAGGLIQRGEYVDVYLTTRISVAGKPESTTTETAPIARNLKVIVKRNNPWNMLLPVDPNKPIDYTLEANPYRAALIEYSKFKGELALVPTAAPQELQAAARRDVVAAAQNDPTSKEYQSEDERVAEFMRGERAIGEADLERVFNLKPLDISQFVKIEKYTGVHYQGVQYFGGFSNEDYSHGKALLRPNTGQPYFYQFSPVGPAKANNTNANNVG